MHFCVWAVTKTNDENELDKIMQPYHQFECTGIIDEYVNYVPGEDDDFDSLPKYLEKNPGTNVVNYLNDLYFNDKIYHESDEIPSQEELKKEGVYNYSIISDDETKILQHYSLTNPDAKWDWWVVGGRWDNNNNCIKKSEFDIDKWFDEHENAPCYGLVNENDWQGDFCADEEEWKEEFKELWDEIPEDSYIWNVDCHI